MKFSAITLSERLSSRRGNPLMSHSGHTCNKSRGDWGGGKRKLLYVGLQQQKGGGVKM